MPPPSPGHQLPPHPSTFQGAATPGAARAAAPDNGQTGLAMAITAYSIWGLSVIFYKLLASVHALEVIGHRGLWSVICVGLLLLVRSRMGEVARAFTDWRTVATLSLSAALLIFNWGIFVWATGASEVLAVSFGYFINPIFSILLGVIILGERLTRWQKAAVALSVIAVGLQAYTLGGFPWISLGLAGTFALYGYLRKQVNVAATPGLFIESVLFLLPSVALIVHFNGVGPLSVADPSAGDFAGGTVGGSIDGPVGGLAQGSVMIALLALTGPMTAVPLVLFAAAARRLPLTLIGLLQYIVPSLHFLIAVFIFAEPLDPLRLLTFVLIWIALAILSFGMLRSTPTAKA